jgi:hypothetical protein
MRERLIVWHRWLPPPESAPEALRHAAAFRERVKERLAAEHAEVLSELGGTIVCALDPAFAVAAVDACMELLSAFGADSDADLGATSHAITIGTLTTLGNGIVSGDALDRAQALANKARPGELVLDEAAQTAVATTFLFAREIVAGPGVRGEALDRSAPRRRDCRRGLLHLAPPQLPGSAQAPFSALRQVAGGEGRHRVLVVGPYGAGSVSWLLRLEAELAPPWWMHVAVVAAPLAPLSNLSYALRRMSRVGRGPEHLLDATSTADARAIDALTRTRDGYPVARREVISALRHLLARVHEIHGKRAWISMGPLPFIDPATLGVIADATRDNAPDHLLIVRMGPDERPPEAFARGGAIAEIRIPHLSQSEGRALAQSMLGRATGSDIARRAAAMGGSTPLGVAEAVRVLISSGDVLFDRDKFCWRRGPAGRVSTIPVEALLEERIELLDSETRRVLEALSAVPDVAERDLLEEVRLADGLSPEAQARAIEQLVAESLVDRHGGTLALASLVRAVVEQMMPPARLAEVHRFVASSLERRLAPQQVFAQATLGYYMARGGRPEAAVDVLLGVAMSSGQSGFVRSGVRLAAAAVECDPSTDTRARAAQLAQALSERTQQRKSLDITPRSLPTSEPALPVPEEGPSPLTSQAMEHAISAILARDFDAVERSIELLVAAGKDGPGVDRLRAMTLLSKGDRTGAMRSLERARRRAPDPEQDSPRTALSMALVLLEGGDGSNAVREALRALLLARRAGDDLGQTAALKTLAACYLRLDRQAEAEQLERAATRGGLAAHGPER